MSEVQKKRPWFKWYPSDWRGEPTLRLCSRGARSVWVDMLGLMHDSPLVGYLLINGKKPTPDQLARVLGDDIRDLSKWLDELAGAGVYSETDDGIVYSRKMVRDAERSEFGRAEVAKRGGAWGEKTKSEKRVPKTAPNHDPNRGADGDALTLVPNSNSTLPSVGPVPGPGGGRNQYPEDFEKFWSAYPRNPNMTKADAWKHWDSLKSAGLLYPLPDVLRAVDLYRKFVAEQSRGRATPYRVQHADKWLKERKFETFLEKPATPVGVSASASWEADHPETWGKLREQLREMHGSDSLWLQLFGRCQLQPGSPFTVICTDEFERDRLNDRFAAKLTAMFDVPVTFTVRRPFQSSPPSPTPTQELRH